MRRFVFRSPRLGFLAVGPALARPTAAFYRRNRAAFAPFDSRAVGVPVQMA